MHTATYTERVWMCWPRQAILAVNWRRNEREHVVPYQLFAIEFDAAKQAIYINPGRRTMEEARTTAAVKRITGLWKSDRGVFEICRKWRPGKRWSCIARTTKPVSVSSYVPQGHEDLLSPRRWLLIDKGRNGRL